MTTNLTTRNYQFQVFNAVKDIPEKEWMSLVASENIYLSLPFLKAIENSCAQDMDFRYLLYQQNGESIGVAYVQFILFEDKGSKQFDDICLIGDILKSAMLDSRSIKLAMCGNCFCCGEHGYYFKQNIAPSLVLSILGESLHELNQQWAKTDGTKALLFKEFWPESDNAIPSLEKLDFRSFNIDVNMVLPIHPAWKTFDDYLQSLNSKFRTKAKSVVKRSSAITFKVLDIEAAQHYGSDFERLFNSVQGRSAFEFGNIPAHLFPTIKAQLKENFRIHAYFEGEEMIGFGTCILFHGVLDANYVGINYDKMKPYALYQRMLYDFVETALEKGCTEVRFGRTAEEVKSGIGAEPKEMRLMAKHKNKIANTLVKPFIRTLKSSPFEYRKPFKATYYNEKILQEN